MNAHALVKYASALAALAILSACSATAVAPSTAGQNVRYIGKTLFVNGRPVTAARLNPMPRFAAILPNHHAKKKFEYVFNNYLTYASIFDYPKSVAQVGTIMGAGGQGCTNAPYGYGKKIIWNVGGATAITEYEVPDTPIETLSVPYAFPSSCAMNKSGDLAVGILYGYIGHGGYGGGGQILIFKNGTGTPIVYTTPLDQEFFDGYDNKGDLFADGFTGDRSGFALVELPAGRHKFVEIKTNNTVVFPGSVQWDGKYLTILDQETDSIDQYSVKGKTATLKGKVQLYGAGDCAQTWIVKGLVYCGDAGNNDGEVFQYPQGGSAIAVFTGNFDLPLGATAAEK